MGAKVWPGLVTVPETTKTTVTQDGDGYYRVRVPKALGDAIGLADEKVEWEVLSQSSLKVTKDD